MALFTMDAEANRSNKQTAIVPDSLAAPIRTRRQQLLQIGGPIDSLARKAQRLTVLTSTALVTTAAGISSASILGSSLSDTALAIEPSSAFALALLVYTAAAWRMQGRFAKIKSDFWQDWHRLADNLDQDLKVSFSNPLPRLMILITDVLAAMPCSPSLRICFTVRSPARQNLLQAALSP